MSGPFLWDLRFDSLSYFALPRPQLTRIAVGWWSHTVLNPWPNYQAIEHVFGGYIINIGIQPWWWSWCHKTSHLDTLWTHAYAQPPGGGRPISMGEVHVGYEVDPLNDQPTIVILNVPSDGHYDYYQLPVQPPGYWLPPLMDKPP